MLRGTLTTSLLLIAVLLLPAAPAAEPAVKPGQTLPPLKQPVLFDTPEADAILAALQVFPPDNPWNADVGCWPLHPNSAATATPSSSIPQAASSTSSTR